MINKATYHPAQAAPAEKMAAALLTRTRNV